MKTHLPLFLPKVWAKVLLSLVLICFAVGTHKVTGQTTGTTHQFIATEYYNTFSFAHPPALNIRPGDRVVTKTIDAGGRDQKGNPVANGPNPQIGPFYVDGAEPGDVLVVRLEKLEPNRDFAFSNTFLAPYAADPSFLRHEGERERQQEMWDVDRVARVARPSTPALRNQGIEMPFRPMLGCIGVAPPRKEAVWTATPGEFGGNIDYNGMVVGVELMLPVFEPGALLFIGDAHVRQGAGEVLGNALETSMDVEFSVELIKDKKIGWPRIENGDSLVVLGSARPLLQALQHATTELQRWLMEDYGYDERGSSLLMGHALEYEIAQVVDPHFTVVAKIQKSFLSKTLFEKPSGRKVFFFLVRSSG
ncbi:MAG: acetamidase/formamidase family protein, partial [Verrucomicrobia bacterium]|nr:acetamidase/formamidase family protein [Verrucomicrobiota bacterium]